MNTKLTNKLSPLIEGQVPDFIQSDHPLFVTFLKHYYEFLESGELKITATIDKVLQETETTSYILEEGNEKVVLETGSGTTGKFVNNETITGTTSKATAKILVEDSSNGRLFISAQQKFITGETITGGTSNATGIVVQYRGNPVQNIQQLMEYANPDNTIHDFLDKFREQFLNVIPSTLASGVSKRNLIKSVKDLYSAKGTSEGHKYFLRLLLDDEATIKYPEEEMYRISDGRWTTRTLMRVSSNTTFSSQEIVGQKISLGNSISAIVVSAVERTEGGSSFFELELDPESIEGSFTNGDVISAVSSLTDSKVTMTVRNIISDSSISSSGSLYSSGDIITTPSGIGNGEAAAKVDIIGKGGVDSIIIDDAGTGYAEGDSLVFTATGQSNTSTAIGEVTVVSGMLLLEDGNVILNETEVPVQTTHLLLIGETSLDNNNSWPKETTIVTEAGDRIRVESYFDEILIPDNLIIPDTGGVVLEPDTDTKGIRKINLTDGGGGYSALPTITVTSSAGANAKLLASSNSIGTVDDIAITNVGFNYTTAPESILQIKVLLKDITGTFIVGGAVYLDTDSDSSMSDEVVRGTITSWDSTRQLMTITPSSTSPFKIEQETGSNTEYSSIAGENIILEDSGILSLENVDQFTLNRKIYQTNSVYGTIAHVNIAKVDLVIGSKAATEGDYINTRSVLGEPEIRIQDSKYYQQFSYEIQVGASAAEYLDSLKKAVHPSGFLPFGKVSIATKVAAGINIITGRDIPSYTSDTETFTPELASAFTFIFDTLVGRRLGTETDGTTLNTTPGAAINEGFLTDSNLGVQSNKRDLTIKSRPKVILWKQPENRSNPNALKYLNKYPFMHTSANIELEEQTGSAGSIIAWDITERLTTNFVATHGTLAEDLDTTETVVTIDNSVGGTPDYNNPNLRKFIVGQIIQIDDESMKITSLNSDYLNGVSGSGLEATVIRGFDSTFSQNIILEDGDDVLNEDGYMITLEDQLQIATAITGRRPTIHSDNAQVQLNNYTFDRTDGDPTSVSGATPTFDNGETVGGVLLLDSHTASIQNELFLEDGYNILSENSDLMVVETNLETAISISVGDKIMIDDGANPNASTSPILSSLGDISTGINFQDIFQYNVLRIDNVESNFLVAEDSDYPTVSINKLLDEDGSTFIIEESIQYIVDNDDSLLLEDGNDILVEDIEQQASVLPFPPSIWSDAREKAFTLPAEINVSAA